MEWVVAWFKFGVVAGVIASSKRRSPSESAATDESGV